MKRTNVDVVLEATRSTLLELGVKRTTFAEVARRTQMSRATLYTHFPDAASAIASVMARELGALLATGESLVESTARARLMHSLRGAIQRLQDHPVLTKVLTEEPDLLLPYMMARFGQVQHAALEMLMRVILDGQADGSIRPGRPTTIATGVLVAVQSLVMGQRITQIDEEAVATLLDILDQGLRP